MDYFRNLPKVEYSNNIVTNLLARAIIKDYIKTAIDISVPYICADHERADTIAHNYYGDSNLSWIIFYANDILDPITDWFKTEYEFNLYLNNKYQSSDDTRPGFQIANEQIHHYENENGRIVDYHTFVNDVAQTINAPNNFPSTGYKINDIIIMADSNGKETKIKVMKVDSLGNVVLFIPIFDDTINGIYRVETGGKTLKTNFDYEITINEQKRSIKLINYYYHSMIVEQFKTLFTTDGVI